MQTAQKNGQEPAGQRTTARIGSILRRAGSVLAVFIMVSIITCCIVASILTITLLRHMKGEEPIDFEQVKLSYTTIIYTEDASGSPQEYMEIETGQDRTWLDYQDIPKYTRDALIAVEDKRFLEHRGVDWKRTTAAFLNEIFHFYGNRQGGSTLTQQVVRNLTDDKALRVDRKVREILRALQVERDYTKEQILEMYLNTAFFGNNAYGLQAASETYFGKKASELTLAESASIIGITQFPAQFDPFVHPADNKRRQEHILSEMLAQGKIDKSTYKTAVAEHLDFQHDNTPGRSRQTYNYFVDHLVETVIDDLRTQKGYSYEDAENLVNRGGLRIYATVDPGLQDKVSAFYKDAANFPPVNNAQYPQSAFVALSPDGKILALAGGIGDKNDSRAFNRATQAKRQSGSTIKPLAAYLTAFENEMITWSTLMDDHPITIQQNGVDILWPVDFQGSYAGMMTIDRALRESRNTIAVKLVEAAGPQQVFNFLQSRLGFDSLVPRREGQSHDDVNLSAMALGGMTYGVTPLEMAGGYQIYANGGYFTKPYCYTKVLDARGNALLVADTTARRVIAPETATVMNRLLQRVTMPGGTGNGARWGDLPVAGKTGTATSDYDQWFMGVTPYMVTATWMGYDEPEEIGYRGLAYAPPVVFHRLAAQLHEGLPYKDFPVWGDVVQKAYCTESGGLAVSGCTATETGWYASDKLPEPCKIHSAQETVRLKSPAETDTGSSTQKRPKLLAGSKSEKSSSKSEKPGYKQNANGLWVKDDGSR